MAATAFCTVHLNGTSREALIEQQRGVYVAVNALLDALRQASPHSRDYYVQADQDAILVARAEHEDRMRAASAILKDCEATIEHLMG